MSFSLLTIGLSTLMYCTVVQILLLSFLLYASIKKYPISKIVGIGLIFILHALHFVAVCFTDVKVVHAFGIPHLIGTVYHFDIVISIGCFVGAVLLLSIKSRLARWLIYGWSSIVGLFNIIWTGSFFYISQTYMEIDKDFDLAVSGCWQKFFGLRLEALIDSIFYINFFLLAVLVVIVLIPPIRKLIKAMCSKTT